VSDERVIEYLRFRGQAQPPTDLVPRVMAAVETSPVGRSPFAAFLPASVAVGVAAVVTIVALLVSQGPDVGPSVSSTPEASPRAASVGELEAAVTAGVEFLREGGAVEGIGTASVLGELGSATWFSWRPSGDQVVINRSDVDVTQTGWWLNPEGGPPARGVNITTTIQVLAGDTYYRAAEDVGGPAGWTTEDRASAPDVLGLPFPAVLDGTVDPWEWSNRSEADGHATVQRLPDGGAVWTLTRPVRGGSSIEEFRIGPDGALISMSSELVGVEPNLEDAPLVTSGSVELTVLSDAEPIPAPDVDVPPDLSLFGLPTDFPLETDASGDIDYVEYIETALDAMEAYHWNTAAIDWQVARAAALEGLPDEPTAGQAHQRIRDAILTFDDSTTVFVRPDDVPTGDGGPEGSTRPSGERVGDVAYLDLPALDAGGPDDVLGYLQDGRSAMASIESAAPACGWIVDVRDTAFGAYPPLFGVVGGLLGDGRVITFDSALGDWWVDVNEDGTLAIGGEERAAGVLDSPAVAAATADEERQDAEFAAMLERTEPHVPAERDAPVVVLTSNATAAAGEQLVVAFGGRPATRVIGGVTSGTPYGQMSLEMVDGARLRIPVSTILDRDGTVYDSNLVPDDNVAVFGGSGGDPAIDAAVEWLEGQPGCS
jgi:carboxyl-terminal processing protease